MAIRLLSFLFLILLFSCSKNEIEKQDTSYDECRYKKPTPIFSEVWGIHSFKRVEKYIFIEDIVFKDSLNAPFEELKIIHQGCDEIIQTFAFKGGNYVSNFKFLGSLAPQYVIYYEIGLAIDELILKKDSIYNLTPNFYIKPYSDDTFSYLKTSQNSNI